MPWKPRRIRENNARWRAERAGKPCWQRIDWLAIGACVASCIVWASLGVSAVKRLWW